MCEHAVGGFIGNISFVGHGRAPGGGVGGKSESTLVDDESACVLVWMGAVTHWGSIVCFWWKRSVVGCFF